MNITRYITEDLEDFNLPSHKSMKENFSKKDQPFKSKIRKDREDYYHYSSKLSQFYAYAYNFISSRVGLKYDDIYSEFCRKVPYWVCDVNTRKEFNDILFKRGYLTPSDYYIDDNGYLLMRQKKGQVPGKKPIVVTTKDSYVTYKPNKDCLRFFKKAIYKNIGLFLWYDIMNSNEISEDKYKLFYSRISETDLYDIKKEDFMKSSFERIEHNGRIVYPSDKDYIKCVYEENRRKAKEKKQFRKQLDKSFETDLNKSLKKNLNFF